MSTATNIKVSSTKSVDVSLTPRSAPVEVKVDDELAIGLSINEQSGNAVVATQKKPSLSLSVGSSNDLDVQTKQKMSVSVINPNKYVYTEGSTWGDIVGTITNQTDLVNYITSRLPDIPFETIQEILDAMNDLSSIDFTAPVKIFGTDTAGDPISFTIPTPLEQFESGTPYVMVVAPDGTVQWREIGLEYISGTNNLTFGGGAV